MAKQPQFYYKFINAFFKRARAEVFPCDFLTKEASKVLKGDELTALDNAVDKLVELGALEKKSGMIKLVDSARIPL